MKILKRGEDKVVYWKTNQDISGSVITMRAISTRNRSVAQSFPMLLVPPNLIGLDWNGTDLAAGEYDAEWDAERDGKITTSSGKERIIIQSEI